MTNGTKRYAVISLADKQGAGSIARAFASHGLTILSTGGTYRDLLRDGIKVETMESYTGSPEIMGGRVKTLHPRVHGGILANLPEHERDLMKIGAHQIDAVVVNLYPFATKIAEEGCTDADAIENIDIGGHTLLRAAAKNFARVTVLCDPKDYPLVISAMDVNGNISLDLRTWLAVKAFAHIRAYDEAIDEWMHKRFNQPVKKTA